MVTKGLASAWWIADPSPVLTGHPSDFLIAGCVSLMDFYFLGAQVTGQPALMIIPVAVLTLSFPDKKAGMGVLRLRAAHPAAG